MSKDKDGNLSKKLVSEILDILQVVMLLALLVYGALGKDVHMLLSVNGLILLGILIDIKLSH